MADQALKQKIHDALRQQAFTAPDDLVDVTDSDATQDLVHIVVVSRRFEGRGSREKSDLIWDELERSLPPDDWGFVSLTIGATPGELNGATTRDLKYA